MAKTVFWGLRIDPVLDNKTREAAQERGMNLSEFVRYALHSFFDYGMEGVTDDNERRTHTAEATP